MDSPALPTKDNHSNPRMPNSEKDDWLRRTSIVCQNRQSLWEIEEPSPWLSRQRAQIEIP